LTDLDTEEGDNLEDEEVMGDEEEDNMEVAGNKEETVSNDDDIEHSAIVVAQ